MWEMKSDLVPVSQLHTSKDSTDESTPVPWSYRPLDIQDTRWYWNKQPYSLKGSIFRESNIIEVPMPSSCPCKPLEYLRVLTHLLCNAALYQQDIQHRAHLQRFGNADTHTLEKSYR